MSKELTEFFNKYTLVSGGCYIDKPVYHSTHKASAKKVQSKIHTSLQQKKVNNKKLMESSLR